jgi:hypothetical protein
VRAALRRGSPSAGPQRPLHCYYALLVLVFSGALCAPAAAADRLVKRGGDLQAALDAARPGDTILLEAGATYTGNFRLPVHGGTTPVTVRSAAPDAMLPPAGTRMTPQYEAQLPKLKSPNTRPAIVTAPGAAYWRLMLLEFQSTDRGYYDIIALGDGAQSTIAAVPHHLVLDRLYIHGDPIHGQKRGIGLNSASTEIRNSYIVDIKAVGQDSQAIAGWNGPGPYVIENNYLEAAGEVFLLGGSDPAIPDLVPTDIEFRLNTVTRPVAWRGPIIAAPQNVRATTASGGRLTAGSYTYRVLTQRPVSDTTAFSQAAEVATAVAASGRVTLNWNGAPAGDSWRVYRRGMDGRWASWAVSTPSFIDEGQDGDAGAPHAPTVWQVKNLFELKNGRRVRIERNVFANNWEQAQSGGAILFTPRNQDGRCRWCIVEDVTFEANTIRSVGAAFTVLGRDDEKPSQQLNGIRIRNNLVVDLASVWGGAGYFMVIMGDPRDVIVDHNTIISPDAAGVVAADGPPIRGFVFTNNVARHNRYGILGTGKGVGMEAIKTFFPDAVITRNVFADNSERYAYPPGNDFPSAREFEAQFVDYADGDFSLKPASKWRRAGSDGKDLGAPPPGDDSVSR